ARRERGRRKTAGPARWRPPIGRAPPPGRPRMAERRRPAAPGAPGKLMAGGGESAETVSGASAGASPHPSPPLAPERTDGAVGLRLIITYKVLKAAVQAALAALLPILQRLGVTSFWALRMTRLAEHVAHRSTAALARRIAALLTPTHLTLISIALALDAALTGFEGWALHRRFHWAPWLVVVAGSTLIPFEVVEL